MLHVPKSDENKFLKGLRSIFKRLIDDTKKGTGVQKGAAQYHEYVQSVNTGNFLTRLIGRMTNAIRTRTAASWREAASRGSNGAKINEAIKNEMKGPVGQRVWQLVSENSAYIKTLPDVWAAYASEYAAKMTMKGRRPEEVEAELRKVIPQHMQRNLKTIARTECAKANAAIAQARAEMCDIKAYIWRCVKDERSRESHKNMDGVLVFYSDPPSPEALVGEKDYGQYHAGNTFNCRCYQEPVVDVNLLPDVMRVYSGGKIRSMTKKEIKKMYSMAA